MTIARTSINLILFSFVFSFPLISAEAPDSLLWLNTYDRRPWDEVRSLCAFKNNGIIFVGRSGSTNATHMDAYIQAVDSTGKTLWHNFYGSPTADESFYSILSVDTNHVVIAGTLWNINTDSTSGSLDACVIKMTIKGEIVWQKFFGGAKEDGFHSMVITRNGDMALTGFTCSVGDGDKNIFFVKIDKYGEKLWERVFGGSSDDEAFTVCTTRDGGFVVAGYTESFGAKQRDGYMVRTYSTGHRHWDLIFGGHGNDLVRSVIQTKDRDFMLAGVTWNSDAYRNDYYVIRVNLDGELMWSRPYGTKGDEEVFSMYELPDSTIVLSGYTDDTKGQDKNFSIMLIASDGSKLWSKHFGTVNADWCTSMIRVSKDTYALGGVVNNIGARGLDFGIMMLATERDTTAVADSLQIDSLKQAQYPIVDP